MIHVVLFHNVSFGLAALLRAGICDLSLESSVRRHAFTRQFIPDAWSRRQSTGSVQCAPLPQSSPILPVTSSAFPLRSRHRRPTFSYTYLFRFQVPHNPQSVLLFPCPRIATLLLPPWLPSTVLTTQWSSRTCLDGTRSGWRR